MSIETPELADDPEEVEEIPDDDVAYDALQDVLEEMSSVYHEDNERLKVVFAGQSAAHPSGEFVYINPNLPEEMDPAVTGPNILRLLDDLLAHEVAHVNWSDLHSKKKFSECYPGWGKVPGFIANVLEDEYVDSKRKRTWFGMRSKLAYYVWLHMNTEHRAPPVDKVEEEEGRTSALMTGLFQTALAGYVKGIEDASDDIADFCGQVEPLIERVRAQDDPDERFKLFHAVMQLFIRFAPDPDEVDDDKMEERRRESRGGGEGGEPPSAPPSPTDEPEVDLPPEMKESLEELLEELMEEGEFPEAEVPDMPEDAEAEESADEPSDGDPDESAPDESEIPEDEAPDPDADSGESEKPDTSSDTDSTGSDRSIHDVLSKYSPDELKVVN